MTSEVSICNQALGWLGQDAITSLDDRNKAAEICNNNYPDLRRDLIEGTAWSFALQRRILTQDNSDDENRWGNYKWYAVPDPDNALMVHRVFADPQERIQAIWFLEGSFVVVRQNLQLTSGAGIPPALAASGSLLYAKIVYDVVNPAKFSPKFAQALAARLAADICIPLTSSRQLQTDMWALYDLKLTDAIGSNGTQGANEKIQSGNLTRVRGR